MKGPGNLPPAVNRKISSPESKYSSDVELFLPSALAGPKIVRCSPNLTEIWSFYANCSQSPPPSPGPPYFDEYAGLGRPEPNQEFQKVGVSPGI